MPEVENPFPEQLSAKGGSENITPPPVGISFLGKLKTNWPIVIIAVLTILVGGVWMCWNEKSPTSLLQSTPIIDDIPFDCFKLETFETEELTQISEVTCQACGGKWERLSMDIDIIGCNPRTSDAGKHCMNSSQCIGLCLVVMNHVPEGFCSEYKFRLGCGLEFSEGELVTICRD